MAEGHMYMSEADADDVQSQVSDSSSQIIIKEDLKMHNRYHNRNTSQSNNDNTQFQVRKGKWTVEEENYTNKIISLFNRGYLPIPAGTTLRSYLSEKLSWYVMLLFLCCVVVEA